MNLPSSNRTISSSGGDSYISSTNLLSECSSRQIMIVSSSRFCSGASSEEWPSVDLTFSVNFEPESCFLISSSGCSFSYFWRTSFMSSLRRCCRSMTASWLRSAYHSWSSVPLLLLIVPLNCRLSLSRQPTNLGMRGCLLTDRNCSSISSCGCRGSIDQLILLAAFTIAYCGSRP